MNQEPSFWLDFPEIAGDLQKVAVIIQETCASQNPVVKEGLLGLFDGKGKLLRPGLLLIAAGFGKKQEKIYKLAACLEMLHIATLVHDDVIDDSPLRRGLPAVHTRFGKRDAVLIGDYLLSKCFLLAAEDASPQNAVYLGRLMSRMCSMEIEQHASRFVSDLGLRRYLRKIMGKSAILFTLACHVGADEAKAPRQTIERLRRTGYNIGMAFQIVDDILDYAGDTTALRKPLGNDIREGLVTLPLIEAVSRDETGGLKALFSKPSFTVKDDNKIISLVKKSKGVEAAYSFAEVYTNRALKEISLLPKGKGRETLEKITKRLLIRNT
ncbi:MAG: polyprenyl synthetase family protein [Treponema sp.]|nr:polyprenyl synthetase family protein [Treponema sp.]